MKIEIEIPKEFEEHWNCPNCGKGIGWKSKYCDCGQAIDWSDTD